MVGEVALLGHKPPRALTMKVQRLSAPLPSGATGATQPYPMASQALGTPAAADPPLPLLSPAPAEEQRQDDDEGDGEDSPALAEGGAAAAAPGAAAGGEADSTALCGMAWACWGKLCLADESLAKGAVPLFVQVIRWASSPPRSAL